MRCMTSQPLQVAAKDGNDTSQKKISESSLFKAFPKQNMLAANKQLMWCLLSRLTISLFGSTVNRLTTMATTNVTKNSMAA